MLKCLGLVLICGMLLLTMLQFLIPPDGRITALPFILIALGGYLGIVYGVWLPYRTKKIYKQQKTLQEPYDAEITKDELISTSSRGRATIRWTDFHKYKVGKDLLLVYQSDAIFHMFPRRWFHEGEYEALLEILKSTLGKPRQ